MFAHAMHCCNYIYAYLVSSLTVGLQYTQRDTNGMDNHPKSVYVITMVTQ